MPERIADVGQAAATVECVDGQLGDRGAEDRGQHVGDRDGPANGGGGKREEAGEDNEEGGLWRAKRERGHACLRRPD